MKHKSLVAALCLSLLFNLFVLVGFIQARYSRAHNSDQNSFAAQSPLTETTDAQIAGEHTQPLAVNWLSGACLLIRAEAWRAGGGFDPRFFFYWEEADLCRRVQEQGWRVVFEPAAEAVHLGGGSSGNPALLRQFFRSLYLFYAKHYPPRRLALARLMVGAMALFKAARAGLASLRAGGNPARAAEARGWLRVARL